MSDLCELLRVPPGPVDLADYDPDGTPGFDGGRKKGKKALAKLEPKVAELQEMLSADGYTGSHRRVLLVLQGMDTSGKGGAVKHAVGLLNPGGLRTKSFKAPTKQELSHHFLWRVEKELPGPGQI